MAAVSSRELTPVSYLVLGLVASGAATSYELKQKVARSVGFMWSFPHSALYAEPTGRAELERWLREPATDPPQLRDLGLLKLFFSNLTSEADIRSLAEAQASAHRERLAFYEAIEASIPDQIPDPFPFVTLRMGLMCERAFIAFWDEIAANPPQ